MYAESSTGIFTVIVNAVVKKYTAGSIQLDSKVYIKLRRTALSAIFVFPFLTLQAFLSPSYLVTNKDLRKFLQTKNVQCHKMCILGEHCFISLSENWDLTKCRCKITLHKNNLSRKYKNGIILCVLFIDFTPVRITAKLCNYAAFAQKKAKLSRVVAATSKIVVDFLAGLYKIGREIQFYMVCKNIQLTTISKCHLHLVRNRHSGTKYMRSNYKNARGFSTVIDKTCATGTLI